MSGPRRQPRQTLLFDLELDDRPADGAELLDEAPLGGDEAADGGEVAPATPRAPAGEAAGVRARLLAAGVDLGCHGIVAAAGAAGAVMLGVPAEAQAVPGIALLVVVFSLFFLVVPLAFWGKTAGMAAAGLVCRAADDQPLTFGEAGRRWLGSVLTVALAGVPALLVLGGRSLADRLSGTAVLAD